MLLHRKYTSRSFLLNDLVSCNIGTDTGSTVMGVYLVSKLVVTTVHDSYSTWKFFPKWSTSAHFIFSHSNMTTKERKWCDNVTASLQKKIERDKMIIPFLFPNNNDNNASGAESENTICT